MSEREAWQQGYRAGQEAALASLRSGQALRVENPYEFRCPTCECDIRYPTAQHVVDCKGGAR